MQKSNERPAAKISPRSIAMVLLVIVILASGIYFARRSGTDARKYTNDFNVYYYAAREMTAGRDPYQNSLGDWIAYLYPPLLAELLIPLAMLPVPVAAYIWFLISAAATLSAAWMSASLVASGKQRAGPASLYSQRVLICAGALLIVLRFVLDNFDMGQVNAVVTMFAVAHVYLFAKDRKLASALALAFAVSLKLTPALLIAYHLARKRLNFALLCTVVTATMMMATFLPFGSRAPDVFATFVNRTVKNEQGFNLAYSGNQSLRAALARATSNATESFDQMDDPNVRQPTNALTITGALALLALAVIAAIFARSESAAAPFFACYVLLSPLSWKAHFVALIFPVAFLIEKIFSINNERFRRVITIVLFIAFIVFTLTSHRLIGKSAAGWADSHSLI
ncbi:MAG TPA: glycosyltransferase family 87 protein, partial [Blastocatellia bacterium]|nr:glycosyltransferase family 87 protein [Blastocatellia bacterium]